MHDNSDMNNTGLTHLGSGTLSESEVLKLGMAVCEVLASYSRINAAHKGVCPDNIFVDKSGEYTLGQPATDMGDVAFAAPELMRGGDFDARADIYSLGMVLAYLTGDGATGEESTASDELSAIIRKACAPDPAKRFADVFEMKNALMHLHASMYFDGVSVSIADEVHKQTDGVSAVRKDIRTTEQDANKHRIAEDNTKRPTFTAPWDDTMVVSVPESEGGDTIVLDAPMVDDTAEGTDMPSDDAYVYDTGFSDAADDDARRNDVIQNSRAVTDAQRIAYENRQRKKARAASSPEKSKTVVVAIIVAIAAILLLGCIIAGAVLFNSFLNASPDDGEVQLAQSLTIVSEPNELTYFVGEQISADGLTLEAIYADGTAETVTDGFEVEPTVAKEVGTQTVTVTYNGAEVTYEITVIAKQVSALYLEEMPTRREFAIGEEFDFSGMLIDVLFVDGSHEMINEGYTFEPTSSVEIGEQKVVISYGEKSVSFLVNIVETVVDRIELIEEPTKLSYYVGEAFDTTGLVVLAEYPNGTTGEISSGFTVSPEKFTETGKQTVTVTYGGKTLEFEVEVSRANITRVAVRTMPAKTEYTLGEALVMKGFSMWAYYDNGTSQIITNSYTYTPKALTKSGTQTITVTYLGKSTSFNVTVSEPAPTVTITKIAVATMPKTTSYTVGDTLDSAGLSITVTYSNGKTENLTSGFTCSPTTLSKAGKTAVTVSYNGYTTSFNVNVSEPVTVEGTCGTKAKWVLKGGVLTISGTGDIDDYGDGAAPWSAYKAQIKTVTVESGITSIGAYALANTFVETLNLPDTLRRIDKTALYNTTHLAAINLDSANRSFIHNNGSLISRDGTKLYAVALARFSGTYTIPDGVTTIEAYRLFYNSSIREVAINKDLYSIDPTTFIGAGYLEKFTVDVRNVALVAQDGVLYTKNMNALACYPYAKSGSSYTIPEGVTVIREYAFVINTKLATLNLPSTLIRVDANAFYGATRLTSVTFAGSESAWSKVTIGSGNEALTDAAIKYGS